MWILYLKPCVFCIFKYTVLEQFIFGITLYSDEWRIRLLVYAGYRESIGNKWTDIALTVILTFEFTYVTKKK